MALDVYGLTRHRDLDTVSRFLDEYVDRTASEDRGDDELRIEPLDPVHRDEEWEPALTLSHIVERALDYPRRAFTTYLTSHQAGIERAILGFTRDDQLVLGLSVHCGPDEDDEVRDEVRAKSLLSHLAAIYGCHVGLILLETPPPMSEAEFRQSTEGLRVVFFTTFDG